MRWHKFHTPGGGPRWIDLDKIYAVNYTFDPDSEFYTGQVYVWCTADGGLKVRESMEEVMSLLERPA